MIAPRSAAKNPEICLVSSAITYDFNMDLEEFEREKNSSTPQPHRGFEDTIASYLAIGKTELYARLLTKMPKRNNGSVPQPFGKARLVFAEPISLEVYNDRKTRNELTREAYKRMGECIVVTDTALVMTALRGREKTKHELMDTVDELQQRLSSTNARMDCKSPTEAVDYAEHLLATRGVALKAVGGIFSANQFYVTQYMNNIQHYLVDSRLRG